MGKQYPKRVVRTMIYYIVAFSLLIGVLSGAVQVYTEYKASRSDLEAAFLDGKRDAEGAIALALWVQDLAQLNNLVRAIAKHQDFTEVSVLEGERVLVSAGAADNPDATLMRVYPIEYSYRGDALHIGDLAISADMTSVYSRLFGQARAILLWTIVQTFLVAIFMFFIFYQLMTRHVHGIAGYLTALDPENMGIPMRLERKPNPPEHRDELDMLVSAFNELRGRLKLSQDAVRASREEVEASERRYRAILDDMVDTYYRTDVEGRIVMVSPSAETLLGYTMPEMIGKQLADVYADPAGRPRFLAAFRDSGGLIQGYEERLRRKDGALVWVSTTARMIRDEDGVFVGVEGIARDITAQRTAAEALRESEQNLRLVADSLPALVLYVDRSMRFRFANREATIWYGRTPEDVLQMNAAEVFDPEVSSRLQPRLIGVLRGETQAFSEVLTYPDGKTRNVELRFVPQKGEDGTVEGFLALGIDVTERRMLEERLRQSQKMEALGQLTGGVAHDFNNLLGVILGNVELLLEEPDLKASEREELLQAIARVGARGAGLTRQLLAFSRRQPLRQEPTQLDTDLSEFAVLLRRTLGESITLTIRHDTGLWRSLVDRPLLENALLNLALNARDAMPDGGTCRLSPPTRM
ncbi:PAS domain S-box protein [Breoghania sp. L-A4]|uniref:PAS domain S-box protein n=1 Tax=Breoghania sp. L-A4 TaxID=2304600 RepID=UPI000E35DFE5|nr:PAS domain S-box protein [Breoghania sp. L-A4]AXS41712.1 PAS domain S-box protein [Breoghania sp. L-A4]